MLPIGLELMCNSGSYRGGGWRMRRYGSRASTCRHSCPGRRSTYGALLEAYSLGEDCSSLASLQSDPHMIKQIMEAVTIPVMAKVRIGHFVEAQVRVPYGHVRVSVYSSTFASVYHRFSKASASITLTNLKSSHPQMTSTTSRNTILSCPSSVDPETSERLSAASPRARP